MNLKVRAQIDHKAKTGDSVPSVNCLTIKMELRGIEPLAS